MMGDVVDSELRSADDRPLGRVADAVAELGDDGRMRLVELVTGPEALAGRVWHPLRPLAHRLLHGRFDRRIPLAEVASIGPTVELRRPAAEYAVGRSDTWIADHLLRWIPGSGWRRER